jgi:transcription initiation factor TFIIIB Brf1 subunit/transcription initiation factor TFIIB
MEHLFQVGHKRSQAESSYFNKVLDDTEFAEVVNFESKLFKNNICPNCQCEDRIDTDDLIICRTCAQVICRPFDNSAEYRLYSSEDRNSDPTRVGAPHDPRLPEASLGTIILGGPITGSSKAKSMARVRKYHTWNSVPYNERSLMISYEQLAIIGTNYGINQSAIDCAKDIYVKLQNSERRQGLCRAAVLSSCMYLALKHLGSPRKPREISEIFKIQPATFAKSLKQTQEILAMINQREMINSTNPLVPDSKNIVTTDEKSDNNINNSVSTKAMEYIDLPLSRLPISRKQMLFLSNSCKQIANYIETRNLIQENMPPSLAAGCIAFILKRNEEIHIPNDKLAEVCGISVATIIKCLKRLETFSRELEGIYRG